MDVTARALSRTLRGYPEQFTVEELEDIIKAAEETVVRKTFNDFPTGRYETTRKIIVHVTNENEAQEFSVEFENRDQKMAFIGNALQEAARKNLEKSQAELNVYEGMPRRPPIELNLDGAPSMEAVINSINEGGRDF